MRTPLADAKAGAKTVAGHYVPPSKREVELPTLTAMDIQSEALFPTLSSAKSTKPKPVWGAKPKPVEAQPQEAPPQEAQPQTPHLNFKATMEKRIEQDALEKEEDYRQEQITNPLEMNNYLLEKNGWVVRSLKEIGLTDWQFLEEEDYWNARTEWAVFGILRGQDELNRNLRNTECVWLGGEPIMRTPTTELDWFSAPITLDPFAGIHTPIPSKEQMIRERLRAFVCGK